mmetsp:Transcript_3499/g.5700  ORF Transcript_3499/g.5700 Transcript_3499/m.5700 type:complete len:261 (+) Transcript_3499:342-1124(+)
MRKSNTVLLLDEESRAEEGEAARAPLELRFRRSLADTRGLPLLARSEDDAGTLAIKRCASSRYTSLNRRPPSPPPNTSSRPPTGERSRCCCLLPRGNAKAIESLPVLGNGASNATAVCAHRAEGGAPLIKARVQRNAISFVSDDVDVSLLAASLLLPFAFGDNTLGDVLGDDGTRIDNNHVSFNNRSPSPPPNSAMMPLVPTAAAVCPALAGGLSSLVDGLSMRCHVIVPVSSTCTSFSILPPSCPPITTNCVSFNILVV